MWLLTLGALLTMWAQPDLLPGWEWLAVTSLILLPLVHGVVWVAAARRSPGGAALRFDVKVLDYVAGLIVLAIAIGLGGFAVAFVWAGLSDATSNGFVGSLLLLLIASAVGVVVLAAHQRQDYSATDHKLEFLRDWVWSIAMVIGGLLATLLASYPIGGLLLSMAEHQQLPSGLSSAMLAARSHFLALTWLALQSCSILLYGSLDLSFRRQTSG